MTNILPGTIESYNDTDFPLDRFPRREKRPRAVYNQLNLSPYACFYAASFAACADAYDTKVMDKKLILQVAKDGWDKLVKDGKFVEGVGGRLVDGVDGARRCWNSAFPDKKVASYRTECCSLAFWRAVAMNWAPVVGYYASKEKEADILDDGIVQSDVREAQTFGHLVRIEAPSTIIDNYPTRGRLAVAGRNKYVFDDLVEKLNNGVLFKSAYIFLPV